MPRQLRKLMAGGTYHVTNRGNRREAIFVSDGDRVLFLELLRQTAQRSGWTVTAYCLMPNHYHLLVETPQADLPAGIQRLNGEYAQWFNRSHGLTGHVFQGRYYATLIESDWHLLESIRYIALNPVRAGLCSAPDAWWWSSYRTLVNGRPTQGGNRILRFFGHDRARAQAALRRFVEDGVAKQDTASAATAGSDPDLARGGTPLQALA